MEINGEIVNDQIAYAQLGLSPELMRAPRHKCLTILQS